MMSDNFSPVAVTDLLPTVTQESPNNIRPANRSVATMNAIKAHILSNRLKKGDPLPTEATLVAEFGVSRSSVREALRTLEALDIVEIRHGSGSYVGSMSLEPMVQTLALRASLSEATDQSFLKEVVEQRRWLDLGAAADVVAAFQKNPVPELHDIVDRMEALAVKGERFMQEDIEFHNGLLSSLGNELTKQAYGAFWLVHMSMIPQLGDAVDKDLLATALAHRKMLDAAEAGDLSSYIEAIDEHYQPLLRILEAQDQSAKQESLG